MQLAALAALAIVAQDRTALRAAPRPQATELTLLWQGELLEVREDRGGGYLKVYDYHLERGGYVKRERVHPLRMSEADAPELLAVLRFLRDTPGMEALGISYGAAYLKAAPAGALTAEPFDAIASMAERLADAATAAAARRADAMAHLEVIEQFGIHTRSFERNGKMQICYDGELMQRLLSLTRAGAEERARAVLGLTRPECSDPASASALRTAQDKERAVLLDTLDERGLPAIMRSRVHARRAAVWSAVAYGQTRGGQSSAAAAQRARAELLSVHPGDLGEERRGEYRDAVLRVGAIRWAAAAAVAQLAPLNLTATSGAPGQTCVTLADAHRPAESLVRRCTYGIVWTASAQTIAQGRALVLAVQPLESWRELWVFHQGEASWTVDVLSPGTEEPDEGYVEFAGFAPATQRLLIAREAREHGRFGRHFEELRLADLLPVKQASSPDLLADFGRWQDVAWRRDTLALH